MDRAVAAYVATKDEALGKLLSQTVLDMLQEAADSFLKQNGMPFGAAPHHQVRMAVAANVADIMLGSPHITDEQQERILRLAAFLSYTTARPEYWSPERGFGANPNMTTIVNGYRTRLACLINDHPRAKNWASTALKELRRQLHEWSDERGGWREAPHYAMVSYDEILSGLVMAERTGVNDWLWTDTKLKSVIRWLGQISTPPDSRLNGARHFPAIGNTYVNEPTGEFGLLASLFQHRAPEFSQLSLIHI